MSDVTRVSVTCQETLFHYHDPSGKPFSRARLWRRGIVARPGEQRTARRIRARHRVLGRPAVAARVRGTLGARRIVRSACRTKGLASVASAVAAAVGEECGSRIARPQGDCPAKRMLKSTCVSTRCGEPKWARAGLATRSNWMEGGTGGDCTFVRRCACQGATWPIEDMRERRVRVGVRGSHKRQCAAVVQ